MARPAPIDHVIAALLLFRKRKKGTRGGDLAFAFRDDDNFMCECVRAAAMGGSRTRPLKVKQAYWVGNTAQLLSISSSY